MSEVPHSQAYQATTLADLWEYALLPADQRISLRRSTQCGRPECNNPLRAPREISMDGKIPPKPESKNGPSRIICPLCRDKLWCSQKCARADKERHKLECSYNTSDILKCTILEDVAGVMLWLQKNPALAIKPFADHFILEWARRLRFDPIVFIINGALSEALIKAIEADDAKSAAMYIRADVTVEERHLKLAQSKGNAEVIQTIQDAIRAAEDKAKQNKPEEKSIYLDRVPPPLPPQQPSITALIDEVKTEHGVDLHAQAQADGIEQVTAQVAQLEVTE